MEVQGKSGQIHSAVETPQPWDILGLVATNHDFMQGYCEVDKTCGSLSMHNGYDRDLNLFENNPSETSARPLLFFQAIRTIRCSLL